jgi:polysaccharide deacetylase 2 family uncharacterized protein YibQ
VADKKGGRKRPDRRGSSSSRGGRSRSTRKTASKPRSSAKAKPARSRSGSKKKARLGPQIWFRLAVVAAAVAAVLVAVYLLTPGPWPGSRKAALGPGPRPAPRKPYRPPLYEEPVRNRRAKLLGRLEVALYQALRGAGARDDDIVYRLRAAGARTMSTVLVRIRSALGPAAFAQRVAGRLHLPGAKFRLAAQTPDRAVALISVNGRPTHRLVIRAAAAAPARPPGQAPGRPPGTPTVRPPTRAAHPKPRVAIIIDDIGHLRRLGRKIIDLNLPLTFSVLPYTRFGAELARLAHAKGKVVMVHLPLEPLALWRADPGPGALRVAMNQATLVRLTRAALARVPFAVGVNNHMGSLFTQNREKMRIVLEELKKRGLFFVDSWTSSRSVGYRLAREMCLPTAIRTVFLDHHPDARYTSLQMIKLVSEARRRGQAVGIGHPHPSTYAVLKAYAAYLRRNVDLVPITVLVHRRPGCPAVQR